MRIAVARLACSLAVAPVAIGGCSSALRPPVERINTDPLELSGPQLHVAPEGTDKGDCSSSEPCRQLERADELSTPGTTINVAPGTYAPATLKVSGTPDSPIVFRSTRPWAAEIRDGGTASGALLSVLGSHVDVVGFDITSEPPAAVDGIAIAGSYSRAISNRVHDLVRPCRPNGGIVAGDADYAAHDIAIIGNYVHDIGQGPRDGSCSLLHGIYAAVPGVVVANNLVVRALGDGITSWHAATGLRIVNNTVVDSGQDGILLGNGDAGGTAEGNTGSFVANNILAFNAGDAISEGGAEGVSNEVVANIFHGNRRDIFDLWDQSAEWFTLYGDPMFVDRAADDYRPLPGSPALRSGVLSGSPTTDLAGARRIMWITRGAFQEAAGQP